MGAKVSWQTTTTGRHLHQRRRGVEGLRRAVQHHALSAADQPALVGRLVERGLHPSQAASSTSGRPARRSGAGRRPSGWRGTLQAASNSSWMLAWAITRRVLVQRWPAVP